MSPTANGGPHTRASSVNGGGPVSKENMPSSVIDAMKGANRVFPHLDDLVSVKPDVDIYSPIRTVLAAGETLAKQADTQLDFRRPEIAIQEYIKASIIAVEIIPRHKDYVSIQSDRGELHRRYMALNKRITTQHTKFNQVKDLIKENNERSGVKPSSRVIETGLGKSSLTNGHTRAQSLATNGSINGSHEYPSRNLEVPSTTSNGATPRKKPVIQPKPQALHGRAIQPQESAVQADLASRFARLRSPEAKAPVQDPRIKTQPILIPESSVSTSNFHVATSPSTTRPTGPHELPSVPRTSFQPSKIKLDVQIPQMPRAPDAIYTPTRNAETAATANLPSSFKRTASYSTNGNKNSAPPISTVGPTPAPMEASDDYFTKVHSADGRSGLARRSQPVFIPESVYIGAEDLCKYISLGSHSVKILLVDLRSRAEFESGHIMSQSIICIEPIALRRGISADEVSEGMVIAPDHEQDLFDRRDEFDMVVFYDQSSSLVNPFNPTGDDPSSSLHNFASAVYDFGYEKKLKRRPMLLVGGLDAWVDLLGANSLKVVAGSAKPQPKPVRTLGRATAIRDATKKVLARRQAESRPLTKEEEAKWDATLQSEELSGRPASADSSAPDEMFYARTTDDFFRRYPEVSTMQESMTSLSRPRSLDYDMDMGAGIPKPPSRPPPALPRQRSSGITERGPPTVYSAAHTVRTDSSTITDTRVSPGLTGLQNPSMLCYFNSAIQALSATVHLRQYLKNFHYPPPVEERVPRKGNEASDPPQLMVRNLASVVKHLWSGHYDWLSPKTFQGYVHAVHLKGGNGKILRGEAFGFPTTQQDVTEFQGWLIAQLADELNTKRNVPLETYTDDDDKRLLETPIWEMARQDWNRLLLSEESVIFRQMTYQSVYQRFCGTCKEEVSRTYETNYRIMVPIPDAGRPNLTALMLDEYGKKQIMPGYSCPKCKAKTEDSSWYLNRFTRLPEYVTIDLKRWGDFSSTRRINTVVDFPEKNIDLSALVYAGESPPVGADRENKGPFLYQPYAVMCHRGQTRDSGHYWTIARHLDKPKELGRWYNYNDESVKPVNFELTQSSFAYSIMLRRQHGNL
ncbi:ubiquitin carboxyl-terminal hydrolase-like protein [Halenospora varia]|nr:ubiquitin carboxyl-terminal hydrolase-like protein [Halenospora varia]